MAFLIVETSNQVAIKPEGSNLYITGIFSSAGVTNANGRVYEKKLLERETNKFQDLINSKQSYGHLNHPDSPEIKLDEAAILVESLEWHGDELYGKAKVLTSTPKGQILEGIMKDGGRFGISSRGLGTVNENGKVNEDFNLITYDIVHNASNPASRYVKGIYEGKEWNVKGEEKVITLDEAQKILVNDRKGVLDKVFKSLIFDMGKNS